jgi:hypothetical protein
VAYTESMQDIEASLRGRRQHSPASVAPELFEEGADE